MEHPVRLQNVGAGCRDVGIFVVATDVCSCSAVDTLEEVVASTKGKEDDIDPLLIFMNTPILVCKCSFLLVIGNNAILSLFVGCRWLMDDDDDG